MLRVWEGRKNIENMGKSGKIKKNASVREKSGKLIFYQLEVECLVSFQPCSAFSFSSMWLGLG